MPDVREKLVELLCEAHSKATDAEAFADATYAQQLEMEADYLIANGVTIQRWISVDERLPEPGTDVTVCFGSVDIFTYRYNRWGNLRFMVRDDCGYWKEPFVEVSHWMPLPEPPKEE